MSWVLSCETGFSKVLIFFRCGEGNIISCDEVASVRWTLRSLRPHACGDVLCAEPGRPHAARSRDERSRASRGSSMERSPAGRHQESDDCIVPRKPRTKPSNIGRGDGGGKAVGRRKGALLRMSRTQS